MALVLDSTPLSPTQNTYVSAAEMEEYVQDRVVDADVQTSWAVLSANQKATYLVNASRALDTGVSWIGDQYSRDQLLKWPRVNGWIEGFLLDVTTVPERIKEATCEMALWSLSNGGAVSVSNQESFERIWVGPIKLNMNVADGQPAVTYFPDIVAQILRDYGSLNAPEQPGGAQMKTVRLSRL